MVLLICDTHMSQYASFKLNASMLFNNKIESWSSTALNNNSFLVDMWVIGTYLLRLIGTDLLRVTDPLFDNENNNKLDRELEHATIGGADYFLSA